MLVCWCDCVQGIVFAITLAVMLAQGCVVLVFRPYKPGDEWKALVETSVLTVSALAALANLLWYIATDGSEGE